ncbi:MAG: hypothetical protein K0S41_2673 [Anaerocolumna sp.]|jgi:hypothetical protein|nr:hypothetical protein [Anaerocolumna sp.]
MYFNIITLVYHTIPIIPLGIVFNQSLSIHLTNFSIFSYLLYIKLYIKKKYESMYLNILKAVYIHLL